MLVSVVSLLAAASIVSAQSNAPVTTNNPAGAKYVATLPKKAGSNLSGYIEGASGENGKGVRFNVHFDGLPSTGGPFMYHIHAKPVPADGNCTATGAHLDPYHYGEDKSCDASKPEICQTGDLSGKYGTFDGNSFSASYLDPYSSTSPSDPAFFGSVSFVLHLHNKTRIGCANFQLVSGGDNNNGYPAGGYPTGGYPTGGQVSTPGAIQSTPLPSTLVSSGGAAAPTGYTPGYPAGNPPTYPANNATVGVPSPTAGVPIIPSGSPSPTVPSQFTGAASKLASGAGALAAAAAAAFIL